jgi:quinolinate synthase
MSQATMQKTYTPLPEELTNLSAAETQARIAAARAQLGSRVILLGHHYQADEIIRHADATGDSFKLAQHAAAQKEARHVIFCGVHFMAESADILTTENQTVLLPDMGAGCSMADMARLDQVEEAWDTLEELGVDEIIPITYMNSTAEIKDFCGRRGGVVCTSSNASAVLQWAFERGKRAFFFPDQHLGRNTGYSMGIPLSQMPLWDPRTPDGGSEAEVYRAAKLILWRGHCSVHQIFNPQNIESLRANDPERKVLVHPECNFEVVQNADLVGSTEFIIKQVRQAPAGSKWAIGTEYHLVNRLANEHPEQDICSLSGIQCACATMYRIDPPHLLYCLEELVEGREVNPIHVPKDVTVGARMALERMLSLKGDGRVERKAKSVMAG